MSREPVVVHEQQRTSDDVTARPMTEDLLDVTCPRCGEPRAVRFYGPCDECRVALRSSLGSEGRDVTVEAYEPKMNVTPNAVATKD
jgi:hypothetical protein